MKQNNNSSTNIVDINDYKENKTKGATDEFVRKAFQYYGIKILGNGLAVDSKGHSVTHPKDKVMKFFDLVSLSDRKGVLTQAMDSCIREIIRQKRDEEEDLLLNRISGYKEDPNNNLIELARLLFLKASGQEETKIRSMSCGIFIIENFIRQVKQKMNKQPVLEHIMPIFVGKQGFGKSTLVQRLIAPLKNFYSHISLKELVDTTRNYPVFANNYILVCEELAGAKWSEYESIKSTLTASEIEARILGTQQRVLVPNKSTIIGTSNRPSSEVIKDPTGSRRFFDIEIADKLDFDALDKINFEAMWLGVSYEFSQEEKKKFFEFINIHIRPAQTENQFKDLLEEFVENYCLEMGNDFASIEWLFKELLDYAKNTKQENRLPTPNVFSRQLKKRFNFKEARKNNLRGIQINAQKFNKVRLNWSTPEAPQSNQPSNCDNHINRHSESEINKYL